MKEIEYIKVYGLERSGTNILELLLNNLFNGKAIVLVNRAPNPVSVHRREGSIWAWKHGYPDPLLGTFKKLKAIAIVKNPYAWVVSLYNHLCEAGYNVGFHDAAKAKMSIADMLEEPVYDSLHPIARWVRCNRSYVDCQYCKVIRYEDLIKHPHNTIRDIVSFVDIEPNNIGNGALYFKNKASTVGTLTEKSFDVDYYKKKKYMDSLTNDNINVIKNHLDPCRQLLLRLKYAV